MRCAILLQESSAHTFCTFYRYVKLSFCYLLIVANHSYMQLNIPEFKTMQLTAE